MSDQSLSWSQRSNQSSFQSQLYGKVSDQSLVTVSLNSVGKCRINPQFSLNSVGKMSDQSSVQSQLCRKMSDQSSVQSQLCRKNVGSILSLVSTRQEKCLQATLCIMSTLQKKPVLFSTVHIEKNVTAQSQMVSTVLLL